MTDLPVAFSPELASDVLEATGIVLRSQPERFRRRATPPANVGTVEHWVQVTSTTVTDGRQPGTIYLRDPSSGASGTWTAGVSVKVKQVNGFVLQTGKYFLARLSGYTSAGDLEYVTSDQTGIDGTKSVCDNVGVKSWLEENGVVVSVT